MKLNVLHINNSSVKSNFLLSFAKYGNKNKYNYIIACFDKYGDLNNELKLLGVSSYNFKCINKFLLLNIIELYKYVKKNKIDIIHSHTFWVGIISIVVLKLTKVKLIYTRHHADFHVENKKIVHKTLDEITTKYSNRVVAVSEYTKMKMIKNEKAKHEDIDVIQNGIDIKQFKHNEFDKKKLLRDLCIPIGNKIVITISRIHPEKGFDVLIDAILKLNRSDITFLIAGNGVGNSYYKYLVNKIKISKYDVDVKFLSFREDIKDLIELSDIVLHPSLSESFGFVYTEAMVMKRLLVCSNIEIIDEVPTKDVAITFDIFSSTDLVAKINYSLFEISYKDKEKRLELGYQRCINLFSSEVMVSKYEKIYETM